MSKKRKRDQPEPDAVPAQDDPIETPSEPVPKKTKGQLKQEKSERRAKKKNKATGNTEPDQESKSSKKTQDADSERRSKKSKKTPNADPENAQPSDAPDTEPKSTKKKSKSTEQEDGAEDTNPDQRSAKKRKRSNPDGEVEEAQTEKTPARFIVFVGNLPYDATVQQVEQHFVKLAPTSVRMSTDKATGRGKGFAFVEFDGYDKMKTCLKLYHHSIFDPESKVKENSTEGKSRSGNSEPGKSGRRINVELTAGGGGAKSKGRKDRIKTKNKKLDEERERQRLKELAEKGEQGQKKREAPQTGANATQPDNGTIHPSRLSRMAH